MMSDSETSDVDDSDSKSTGSSSASSRPTAALNEIIYSADSDVDEERPLISTSSFSSSRKKVHSERCGCCRKLCERLQELLRSPPDQHRTLKTVIAFPIGVVVAFALHYTVIDSIKLPLATCQVVGGVLGVAVALGFGLSTSVRCIVLLVVPTFFGKSGRSHIATFAVVYLIAGPVHNILSNAGEMTNSLTCVTELLANHTAQKWLFRMKPVQDAMAQIQKEGFLIKKIGKVVNKAFEPIRREMENSGFVEKMKKRARDIDRKRGHKDRASAIEQRHKLKPGAGKDKAVENTWEKKLDYRCEDVFTQGVENCRNWFRDLEKRCMKALWLLGYIMCLPLKLTVICEIVRVMPGAIGLDCNSMEVVNPGVGETYTASRDMIDNMDEGFSVNMQYKVVADTEALDYTRAEEARKATMYEFSKRRDAMEFVMTLFQRVLAFMFLFIFFRSYRYEKNYLTDFKYDNIYITKYFRHIDFRRKQQGKTVLLPLKKIEENKIVYPTSRKLMATEKSKLVKGTVHLLFRALVTGIVIMMDFLLFWVLDVIRRHSRVDYKQQGKHRVSINVEGRGFISEIVRMFLLTFNSEHEIHHLTTNADCLPSPTKVDTRIIISIYSIYVSVWVFMYFEAYGLRLRRQICCFFYRKREKRRVLYMYNDMLKKRKGFLRQMRHKVRKQVKAGSLSHPTGVLSALVQEFPRCCKCLERFAKAKPTCLICEDPKNNDFHDCETEGCKFTYCKDCWLDVKKKCYACQKTHGGGDGDDISAAEDDSDITDDDIFD
ncbi:E3 ubiquitin-protein ligase DCST1-like isoform X1 [Haliotis rufescens]|uniref:E3 ubiquitin-protein ligase DCST1-like isoform X1 n=1 Tax=Haliotis rufescens TaxID=6454 RepID=UPI00201F5652|nr:E3 ubiquitin-protein ligase DCST1-like isoform X1 [Haliotis rufescens]